jgi:tRNA (cytidine/uridine-2'-O-)-methyltransferase
MLNLNGINVVLYKPEIALNVGNIMRTCACLGATLHIIEPLGFPMGVQSIFPTAKAKRTALDYECHWHKYPSWNNFLSMVAQFPSYKLVAITPHTNLSIKNITPHHKHILVFGRESDGFDDEAHSQMDLLVSIPMELGQRSFNLAISVAMVLNHWSLALKF